MATAANELSWSYSRHDKLKTCARAYFFHYYQSRGGWEPNASQWTRQLYVLKKLDNRFTWSGSLVHSAVRGVLMALRHGRVLDAPRLIDRVHQVMRQDFRYSRAGLYWQKKRRRDFRGLLEHEYAEPLSDAEWRASWETVRRSLGNFLSCAWVERVRDLPAQSWLEVDTLDFERSTFLLDGVRTFAVPDFAFLDRDGSPVVVDWKTGRGGLRHGEQMVLYALYVSSRYGCAPERVRAHLVYLAENEETEVPIAPAQVDEFRATFAQSVARMRDLLLVPSANVPLPEHLFPMTDNLAACARCPFRRPCGREALLGEARVEVAPASGEPRREPEP